MNRSVFNALLGNIDPLTAYEELNNFKQVDTNVYNSLKFFQDNDLT